jgi:soluble lytic murein transglycosylase-like protein
LLDRCDGDIKLALAAYNAGMQNIIRYDGIPPFPETRAYISRVLEHYAVLKQDAFRF